MSESENIPTPLYSLPLSSCDLSLLLRRMPFSLSLILATPFAPLHLALVSALLLYPDLVPRSVQTSKSLLEVVQPSFPLPISVMLSTLSHLARLARGLYSIWFHQSEVRFPRVKLKAHILPWISEIHVPQETANASGPQVDIPQTSATDYRTFDDQSLLHELNNVVFKGNRIYQHPLLRLNYTAYDLQRETEMVNPKTDHCNIMLLSQADGPETHPFCYARVLGIYHANIIYTGPNSRDYQSQRIEFLWVRWFKVLDQLSGWEQLALDIARFVPMVSTDAFSFMDPADIL